MSDLEQTIARLRTAGYFVNGFNETDSRGAAYLLGLEPTTLANRRAAGRPLPPARRFGRTYWFDVGAMLAWRRSRETR
jgi:hypothetical protein